MSSINVLDLTRDGGFIVQDNRQVIKLRHLRAANDGSDEGGMAGAVDQCKLHAA